MSESTANPVNTAISIANPAESVAPAPAPVEVAPGVTLVHAAPAPASIFPAIAAVVETTAQAVAAVVPAAAPVATAVELTAEALQAHRAAHGLTADDSGLKAEQAYGALIDQVKFDLRNQGNDLAHRVLDQMYAGLRKLEARLAEHFKRVTG